MGRFFSCEVCGEIVDRRKKLEHKCETKKENKFKVMLV
jgi:hypothetical protein